MDFDWLSFDGVNWLAVLVAFVATFALGWVWYSNVGFFKMWQRLAKIADDDMKAANMGVAFGGTAIFTVLGVILLAVLMPVTGATTVGGGAVLGAILGFVFRGGAHAIHNGFAARDWRVTLIDTAHDTVGLAVAGAILGLFD